MKALGTHTAAGGEHGPARGRPALLLALLLALGACGQKGALYLPQKGRPVPAQPPAPSQQPASPQNQPSTQLPTLPPESSASPPDSGTQTPAAEPMPQAPAPPATAPDPAQTTPPPDDSGS